MAIKNKTALVKELNSLGVTKGTPWEVVDTLDKDFAAQILKEGKPFADGKRNFILFEGYQFLLRAGAKEGKKLTQLVTKMIEPKEGDTWEAFPSVAFE